MTLQANTGDKVTLNAALVDLQAQQADASTTGPQACGSFFLRVPGEVRNAIYGYVFGGEVAHARPSYHRNRSWVYPTHLLALTLTCRQMYQETKFLPFTLGTFHGTPKELVQDLQRTLSEAQRQAVNSICLQVSEYDMCSGYVWTVPDGDDGDGGDNDDDDDDNTISNDLSSELMHEETVFIAESIDQALRGLTAYQNIKRVRVECRSSGIYDEYGPVKEQSGLQCRERALVTEMEKRLCATNGGAGVEVEMAFPF